MEERLTMVDKQEALRIRKRLKTLKRGDVHRVKVKDPMAYIIRVCQIPK
jgi:hypothetical protein